MRVKIRLFARLRDLTGAAELLREVPDGATARDVWQTLVREFPEMDRYAASVSAAVNEDYAKMSTLLRDGDEVAFLPPVSGGRVPHVNYKERC